jgi:SH3-like domain-containing protein
MWIPSDETIPAETIEAVVKDYEAMARNGSHRNDRAEFVSRKRGIPVETVRTIARRYQSLWLQG